MHVRRISFEFIFLQIIYRNSTIKFAIISYSIFLSFYLFLLILLYLKKIVRIIERYLYYEIWNKIYSSNEEAIEIHNKIRKSENSTWVCLNVKVITMQESY